MSESVYSRQEVLDKARELGSLISETEEVDFFKRAEAQINRNVRVQELIQKIKNKQKQAVNLQHYEKKEALKQAEDELAALNEEIESIPIVQEFQQSQKDVNELLQLVSTTISNKVTDEIIESTGGDKLKGTTGPSPFMDLKNQ
ncbi:RicAFT regulatory complex protein RicA family protein [Salibacterium sp. K-3]